MLKNFIIVLFFIPFSGICQDRLLVDEELLEYMKLKMADSSASKSVGTVSKGSLSHGRLMPYKGKNFIYFDRDSYLAGRAFVHEKVRTLVLATYDSLNRALPRRYFCIMECSNENGGELFPHRTHQNGLSVDFMIPLLKNGQPYYGLDTLGASHYALSFDNSGKYTRDTSISVDFNLVARHILLLDYFARKNGVRISKVIIKIEFKSALFATEYGRMLKNSGIYVVQGLTPIVNSLHDEHFHIDFEII